MSEEAQNQDGQKTIVAFIVGLLIGGLLTWAFVGSPAESPENNNGEDSATSDNQVESVDTDSTDDETDTTPDASTSSDDETDDTTQPQADMSVGEGDVAVSDQAAGMTVTLDSVTFPNDEGWIGVRRYTNGDLGSLLGVVRFSKEQGLVPEEITLQAPTTSGNDYAVVFYTESGDREFSLADDVQVGDAFATFTAQ